MAINYVLKQNHVRGTNGYGKYYAQAVRAGVVKLDKIEQMIQTNCTLKRSDVRAVMTELTDTVVQLLQEGKTVDLGEMGRLRLCVHSRGVDRPEVFDPKRDLLRVTAGYQAVSKRSSLLERRLTHVLANHCKVERKR